MFWKKTEKEKQDREKAQKDYERLVEENERLQKEVFETNDISDDTFEKAYKTFEDAMDAFDKAAGFDNDFFKGFNSDEISERERLAEQVRQANNDARRRFEQARQYANYAREQFNQAQTGHAGQRQQNIWQRTRPSQFGQKLSEQASILELTNPFDAFMLPKDATWTAVKQRFRVLAKKYDPNRGIANQSNLEKETANHIMVKINLHYERLKTYY